MKKVIFISALAIAAAVSCTKSDIVDTKFNEQISFETYTGRDAMTKAKPYGPTAKPTTIGLYGFYTGATTEGWTSTTNSNLWGNEQLSSADEGKTYTYTNTKFWTNDTDKYTFFAYAPFSAAAPTGTDVKDPAIQFTVNPSIPAQEDFLYSNNKKNTVKTENKDGVGLEFKHALSRITVKAVEEQEAYSYTVYGVTLSGQFNTSGSLRLSDAKWNPTAAAADYVFLQNSGTGVNVPEVTTENPYGHDFSVRTVTEEGTTTTKVDNYLMVIPTDFSSKTGEGESAVFTKSATLTVTYTTWYDGHESNKMTKTLPINTDFQMGKAYSLNLKFAPNEQNAITFTVSVDDWGTETNVTAGNPETGTPANQQ